MSALEALLEEGKAQGAYDAARAVVVFRGHPVFEGGTAPPETLFDLASLTKVMSTTALCSALIAQKRLTLGTPLSELLPGAAAGKATVADLLCHRSGLPAFVPFFAEAVAKFPSLLAATPNAEALAASRALVVEAALRTAPTQPAGAQAVYSDVGFILLGEALAKLAGLPLDAAYEKHVAAPLGLSARFRRVSAAGASPAPSSIAPTGKRRPRPPAPGQEGWWSCPDTESRPGEVDDDNAWAMDGVAGHAGLFATAAEVARFGRLVLEGRVKPLLQWEQDTETPGSTRAPGFDTPSPTGASCGQRFGDTAPGAIGHLGFTGTSLWIDRHRQLVVVLLTNRVALGRDNLKIRDFRPRFHDAVLGALSL